MRRISIFFAFCCVIVLFSACNKKPNNTELLVPLVQAVKVTKTDINWDVEYPAQVAGSLEVDVRAQVSGILKQKFFEEGSYVEQGTQLYQIDPVQYEIALKKAKGSFAQTDSEVKKTKRDYDRMKALFAENAVSKKDFDDSLSAYEKAKANLQVAQSVVDDANMQLTYTKVQAPASGITRGDHYSVGNLISTLGEAGFLLKIVAIDPLEIRFSIPSQEWNAGRRGYTSGKLSATDTLGKQTMDINVIAPDGTVFHETGKFKFIDSSEDTNTGTISAKATLPNPKKSRILMPGQFVKVVIKGMIYKDAVPLPATAILTTAKGSMVYVIENGNAVLKPVKVVHYKGYAIAQGLNGDETVITAGLLKVKPASPVKAEMQNFDISSLIHKTQEPAAPADQQKILQPENKGQ